MIKLILDCARVVFNFSKWLTLLAMVLMLVPKGSHAGSLVTDPDLVDNQFEEYILRPCIDGAINLVTIQGWSLQDAQDYDDAICSVIYTQGTYASSDSYASSSNIGSLGAQGKSSNAVAQQQVVGIKDHLEELKEEEDSPGGWGWLLSAQAGKTDRFATNLETGYESDLESFMVGLDYRFDNQIVVGLTTAFTQDKADFDNNKGELTTDSFSVLSYFTFAPSDSAYLDAYVGIAPLDFSGERAVSIDGEIADAFGFAGTIKSDFEGDQFLAGLSGGYDWFVGDFSIGPFVAIDYIKTEIDGYDERGATNLELRYEDQTSYSTTASVGLNLSHTTQTSWGAIVPNVSISTVHQHQDDARRYDVRLIALPAVDPSTLQLKTDDPDRDYALINLGLVLATNSGTQYFANYEQMESNDYMDNWAFSIGILSEF